MLLLSVMIMVLSSPKSKSTLPWINYFECGGIALSFCMSHKLVGDACSAYNFLRDWARLTRDPKLTLSPPYFAKDSLMPSPFDGPLLSHVIEPKKKRCIQKRAISISPTLKLAKSGKFTTTTTTNNHRKYSHYLFHTNI
ncbi:hypothetical protein MTR67_016746 [Solanum verrucosum]|uniref:Uncharacterized protein n=1 Tax=Solanum verrucosum TaxID=315347 RepID=A0AAF0TKW8_SOLVR|nr:hypothetical protein MTR67_016746 [Solanum verrucosum]